MAHLCCFACRLVLRHAGGVTERARALASAFRVAGTIVNDGAVKGTQGNEGNSKGTEVRQSTMSRDWHADVSTRQVADGHGLCTMHSPYKAQCLIETQHLVLALSTLNNIYNI
jgi:hypothetical protein